MHTRPECLTPAAFLATTARGDPPTNPTPTFRPTEQNPNHYQENLSSRTSIPSHQQIGPNAQLSELRNIDLPQKRLRTEERPSCAKYLRLLDLEVQQFEVFQCFPDNELMFASGVSACVVEKLHDNDCSVEGLLFEVPFEYLRRQIIESIVEANS